MKTEPILLGIREDGLALIDVLARHLKCSKKQAKTLLDAKQVLVNGRRIWMAKHEVHRKDVIEVLGAPSASTGEIEILKTCADAGGKAAGLFIVNKPAGLVTNGSSKSLEARLKRQLKQPALCAVHRLDRETSGSVIFARDEQVKAMMIPLFREQRVIKIYRAIVAGRVSKKLEKITRDIDGESATTLVNVLDAGRNASYLELRIKTGRTHQIRRHLAEVRHPVLGDKQYGGTAGITIPRQMLHASRLILPSPETDQPLRVSAPVPKDFRDTLKTLRLK